MLQEAIPQPPRPPTPVARILARLDEALGAKMPPRGIERVVGPGLTEISVRRWRDGVSAPTGRKAQLFAEAMGLSAEHVMGWAPLPPDWPPPAVVARFQAERKPVGRPPRSSALPAPAAVAGASPELARQVEELRAELGRLGTLVERVSRIERVLRQPIMDDAG